MTLAASYAYDNSKPKPANLQELYQRIDAATNDVLDLLREKDFSREGLLMVMLGKPNQLYLNGATPKKINHATLGEILVDSPCPGRSYNAVNLRIIEGGVTTCLTMPNPTTLEEQASLSRATHSTINEIALYKALVSTAEHALGNEETDTQKETVESLKSAIGDLHDLVVSTMTFSPEATRETWDHQLQARVDVYAGHFKSKRTKPQISAIAADGVLSPPAQRQPV